MASAAKHGRLFAVGDIHGCPDEVAAMLKAIAPRRGDTVVFIGDYVDRGPSAKDVVDQLLELENTGCKPVFLKGNHEDMMLSFLGLPGLHGDSFLMNGGAITLASYGIKRPDDLDCLDQFIPEQHLEFYRGLEVSYLRPPYLFVHAGVMPLRPLEEQDVEDLLWIRHEFISQPHDLGQTVVFGHTPMRSLMMDLPYKIGIDTGLVYGNKLTCVEFTEGVLYQVARHSRTVKSKPLKLD